MELDQLLFEGEYEGEPIPRGIMITGIENDGRRVAPGVLFFCHRGTRFDSHTLLPSVAGAGCAAAVVSDEYEGKPVGMPVIRVKDTRRAEAIAVSRFYGSPAEQLTMIGVTGTNGKTSVATMIWHLLNDAGIPCAMIGTTGYRGVPGRENDFDGFRTGDASTMTTPPPPTLYPLLAAAGDAGITHVVMEVSSQALSQARVAPIRFALAVFTNLSPEHLDYHGTMTEYLEAKKILFRQSDTAVYNGDSPWSDLLLDGLTIRKISCGTLGGCNVRATDVSLNGRAGVSFVYRASEGTFPVSVPIPGTFTVQNALLALTAAKTLGVDLPHGIRSLARVPTIPGRMERIDTGDLPFSVFIDYAHTEAALRSLLTSVRAIRQSGERIVVLFGCGGDRDPSKRCEMGKTAAQLADLSIVTSDNSRSEDPKKIIRSILSGMKDCEKRRVFVDREKAIRYAITNARPGDLILLVGKGHEKYEITRDGVREFDEKKIVLSALEERRAGHTMEESDRADQNRNAD